MKVLESTSSCCRGWPSRVRQRPPSKAREVGAVADSVHVRSLATCRRRARGSHDIHAGRQTRSQGAVEGARAGGGGGGGVAASRRCSATNRQMNAVKEGGRPVVSPHHDARRAVDAAQGRLATRSQTGRSLSVKIPALVAQVTAYERASRSFRRRRNGTQPTSDDDHCNDGADRGR